MQTLKTLSGLSASHHFLKLPLNPTKPFFPSPLFSSPLFSSLTKTSNSKAPNPVFVDYLIKTFNFSKTQAISVSTHYSHVKSLEKPQSVVHFLQSIGFSNTHIQSSVRLSPQILLADIKESLEPKIQFFQHLGLVGIDLGNLISKNTWLLTVSLEKKLVSCVEILKKVLLNDENNEDLFKVLRRCSSVLMVDPQSILLPNIALLKSCGIVGSQLAMLLRRQPRIFVLKESTLRDLVSRALNMGFSVDSRMFVHGLYTVSCLSNETFERKIQIFISFGFSKDECLGMFRKAPSLFRESEEKLKLGIGFYLNIIKLKKEVLVHRPAILLHSMEERAIPRYRVLDTLKSKRLLKKEPSFINVLSLTEEEFLDKFVSRFNDHAEELLVAYKGHLLDSSSAEEEST